MSLDWVSHIDWLLAKLALRAPHRARVAGAVGAVAWMLAGTSGLASAQTLTLNLNSLSGGGSLLVTTSLAPSPIELLPGVSLPSVLRLDNPVTLQLGLDPGFALTSASCTDGSLLSLGGNTFGLTANANVSNVSCTFATVNALLGNLQTVVPLLLRQNDFLMSLDLGLERQIDLLSPDGGGDGWGKPSGLGGSGFAGSGLGGSGLGFGGDPWGDARMRLGSDSAPSSFSFATSLRQMREASPAPYGLGATSARAAAPAPKFDVWAEGYLAHFDDDTGPFGGNGRTGVLYVGADYLLTREILLGALVQFDDTEEEIGGWPGHAKTTGWMAGPYATLRLPYNLFFQARAAWGGSDNEITIAPGNTDQFDADRWLVRGTLLGQWDYGRWRFQPRASVGYIAEDQEGYKSWGVDIPGQTVSLGQAKAGPQISYRERLANGTVIEPSLLVEGIWNFHQDAGAISVDDLVTANEVRGRTEAGVTLYTRQGVALGASFSYDGIGSGDYQAIGGRAKVRVPLN